MYLKKSYFNDFLHEGEIVTSFHYGENTVRENDGQPLKSKFTKKACVYVDGDGQPQARILLCNVEPVYFHINESTKTLAMHQYRKSFPKKLIERVKEYARSVGCDRLLTMSHRACDIATVL